MVGTVTPAGVEQTSSPAPRVRQDLSLFQSDPDDDGGAAWTLHDPMANRYYRLDQHAVELLAFVDGVDANTLARNASGLLNRAVHRKRSLIYLHFFVATT